MCTASYRRGHFNFLPIPSLLHHPRRECLTVERNGGACVNIVDVVLDGEALLATIPLKKLRSRCVVVQLITRLQTMKTILVYRNNLLPWSETFIKEQMLALRRWRGVLIGVHQLHQLSLEGLESCVLRPEKLTFADRLRRKLSRSPGMVPRSTIKHLQRERPSLLHAHFGVDATAAWPIAKALDVPMLVTLHGYDINISRDWWEGGHRGQEMRNYPTRLLELANHPRVSFIAVSEAIRSRAISFGIPEGKVKVRYIGIDTAKFTPGGRPIIERAPRVLFIGRLVENKGCEFLIRAFANIQKAVPDASLVIVGDGPLRDHLQTLANGMKSRVEFRGVLSSVDVRRELHLARVFCLPSVTATNGEAEGFGMVLLEAQASGVPVVTSALGGTTEAIQEGITGFAFRERDVDTLSSQLIRLLLDDALAGSFSVEGPKFAAAKFDLRQCTEKLEALYDATVGL